MVLTVTRSPTYQPLVLIDNTELDNRELVETERLHRGLVTRRCEASSLRENKPLHCFHGRYGRLIPCICPVPRGQRVGSLVLFSKPVPTIHGVFAPEVTVESFVFVF